MVQQPNNNQGNQMNNWQIEVDEVCYRMSDLMLSYVTGNSSIDKATKDEAEKIKEEYEAGLIRMKKDGEEKRARLEDEYDKKVGKIESEYSRTITQIDKAIQDEKTRRQKASLDVSTYQDQAMAQMNQRKKAVTEYIHNVDEAERRIEGKSKAKYYKIIKDLNPRDVLEVADIDSLMRMYPDPFAIAAEINERKSGFKEKCRNFYRLKAKAYEFDGKIRQNEEAFLQNMQMHSSRVLSQADEQLNHRIEQFQAQISSATANYDRLKAEAVQAKKYAGNRLGKELENEKNAFEEHFRAKTEACANRKKKGLSNNLNQFVNGYLTVLPPDRLRNYVSVIQKMSADLANGYERLKGEPRSILLGSAEFRLLMSPGKSVEDYFAKQYQDNYKEQAFHLPLANNVIKHPFLYFKHKNSDAEGKETISTVCTNAFLSFPPNKMKCLLFDPMNGMNSFSFFRRIKEDIKINDEFGGLLDSSSSIEEQLEQLYQHLQTVSNNAFFGKEKGIYEYNAAFPLFPMAFTMIGIMDFPLGFSTRALELLKAVMSQRIRFGLMVFIHSNGDQIQAKTEKEKELIQQIEKMCRVFPYMGDSYLFVTKCDARVARNNLKIQSLLRDVPEQLAAEKAQNAIASKKNVAVDFADLTLPDGMILNQTTNEEISVPIGRSAAGKMVFLELGAGNGKAGHLMIGGQAGTGKTKLINTIMAFALQRYADQELQICMMDGKGDPDLAVYSKYRLPGIKTLGLNCEYEFGAETFSWLLNEMNRRQQMFSVFRVEGIDQYNGIRESRHLEKLPRILVILDDLVRFLIDEKGTPDPESEQKASAEENDQKVSEPAEKSDPAKTDGSSTEDSNKVNDLSSLLSDVWGSIEDANSTINSYNSEDSFLIPGMDDKNDRKKPEEKKPEEVQSPLAEGTGEEAGEPEYVEEPVLSSVEMLQILLENGAKCGIHMILCTGDVEKVASISKEIIGLVPARIAFSCEKQAETILLGGASAYTQKLGKYNGLAYYISDVRNAGSLMRLAAGTIRTEYLQQILDMLDGYYRASSKAVMTKVLSSDISLCANSIFQRYVEWGDIFTVARTLHFGNSFQLDLEKMDMGVRFDPAPGNNLLLLGRNEKKAGTMMFFAALDAMLQQLMFKRMVKPEAAPTFTVLDYRNESEVTQDDKLKWIAEKNNAYYNRNRSAEAIEKVYERFLQKKAGDPIEWFMIFDISKASDLRNDSMTGQGIRSLDMFKELLSDGPAKGVFLVVWCGDPEAYRTKMIYSLNHFSYRVVFDLSYDEARAYAKIPKDEDIRREDAYLSCSVRGGSGRPAKFRSYADPSQPWMELLAGRIGVE